MKALILVGGYGTRLRPFTFTKPKPLIPFLNEPIVMHQIRALAGVGVDEVILAISFDPTDMRTELAPMCEEIGVQLHFSQELTPMGTAGPLALAKDILTKDGNEIFFVLNSDVTANYPFGEMITKFKELGKEGLIVGKRVEDPSRYGVIVHDENFKIDRFVEKPSIFVGDLINAGMYIFHAKMLARVPLKPTSIERETFPQMAAAGELFCLPYEDFWDDIGKPTAFLDGMCLLFDHLREIAEEAETDETEGEDEDDSYTLIEKNTVLIHKDAQIGPKSVIGPYVVVGPNCVIGEGVRLHRTTIMEKATIQDFAEVHDSIVGWGVRVGRWAKVINSSFLGEGVRINEGVVANGLTVCPHKGITTHHFDAGSIVL